MRRQVYRGRVVDLGGERIHLFLARDLVAAPLAHEEDEVIERIERVPLADAVAKVRRGQIPDGKTALGLLLAGQDLGVAS